MQQCPVCAVHQIFEMEGLKGFRRSSKGKRPVSSWNAITPALQRSLAGDTSLLSTSGAMYLLEESRMKTPV